MKMRRATRIVACAAVAVMSVAMSLVVSAGAAHARQPSAYICHRGSIPGGVYASVTVRGRCNLDSGTVVVGGAVTVQAGAALVAAFGGSDLVVRRDVVVKRGAILVL